MTAIEIVDVHASLRELSIRAWNLLCAIDSMRAANDGPEELICSRCWQDMNVEVEAVRSLLELLGKP
jgi:hypothetical protein